MKARVPKRSATPFAIRRSSPLAGKAYDVVKRMIVAGDLAAGDQLIESQLAAQLGVSRSPLREALARLAEEGFVEGEPWKSQRVASLTPTKVRETYAVRLALESAAARESADKVPDEEVMELLAALAETFPALQAGDARPFRKLESALHGIYINNCGNALLQGFMEKLQDHIARIRAASKPLASPHTLFSYQEHEAILRALLTHDPDAVETAVRRHVKNATTRIVDAVSGDGTGL